MAISTTIKSIQDIMRKDAGTYGDAQRIEQLAWMFFLKILDDREAEEELLDDDFKSPLKKELRWRNWAADDEGMTGEALLDFVDNKLLKALQNQAVTANGNRRAAVVRAAFEDANNYMKNGTLMRQVINKINEVDFNNSKDRHLFGDVYEKILKGSSVRWQRGRILHATSRDAVHGTDDGSQAWGEDPGSRMRHGGLPHGCDRARS